MSSDEEAKVELLTRGAVRVLNGPIVKRINFKFPTRRGDDYWTITRHTFYYVGLAIEAGRVIVRAPTDMKGGFGAQYNSAERTRSDGTVVRANTLEIASVDGPDNESYLVHECVHAAYDMLLTSIDGNAEEAAGYISAALYNTIAVGVREDDDDAWSAARKIAQSLLRQSDNGVDFPIVGKDEFNYLRLMIGLNPTYARINSGLWNGWIDGRGKRHDG